MWRQHLLFQLSAQTSHEQHVSQWLACYDPRNHADVRTLPHMHVAFIRALQKTLWQFSVFQSAPLHVALPVWPCVPLLHKFLSSFVAGLQCCFCMRLLASRHVAAHGMSPVTPVLHRIITCLHAICKLFVNSMLLRRARHSSPQCCTAY